MKKIIYLLLIPLLIAGAYAQDSKIEIVPIEFNSTADDFSPTLTKFGRLMYFTSERGGDGQKIYEVERTSGGWTVPDELSGDVNDALHCGSVAITPDGQFMVFAAYDHDAGTLGRTDLYSARKVDGEWTDVKNLGQNINSSFWDSQPSLSSNGTVLFFSSDRPGGLGGTDIYFATMDTRGNWSVARNIGSNVNTAYDEMTPVISDDSRLLSFASNRPGGQGGFDIYLSQVRNTSFMSATNIGMPINSTADEYFYETVSNSKKAYFSSNRDNGVGGLDIYMAIEYTPSGKRRIDLNDPQLEITKYEDDVYYDHFDISKLSSGPVLKVTGVVYDGRTKQPIGTDIIVTDLRTGKKYASLHSDDEGGDYYVVLEPGGEYSVTAQEDGYLFLSEQYNVAEDEKGHTIDKDYYLMPAEGGAQTRLLIYFDFDKTDLKDESIPELERVIEFLRNNPDINIMIEGHTDDVGSDEYNNKLSLERADAVKNYIVSAGIKPDRIKTKGFGKKQPLVEDKSDEARAMNRRVEMRVL